MELLNFLLIVVIPGLISLIVLVTLIIRASSRTGNN